MNVKILLLMVLAASVLLLGCAGKAKPQDAVQQGTAPAEPEAEPADIGDDRTLADLFQIDTDKPISDEGFSISTPSSD